MINWRLFFALCGFGLVTALPLIPVVVAQGEAGLTDQPLGWGLASFAVLLGALVAYPAAIFCGLRIGARFGLAAPLIEAWAAGEAAPRAGRLGAGLALGAGFGMAAVLIALTLGAPPNDAGAAGADLIPLWTGLAQAVSAGIGEEILFRFGLMSLFAWFAWKVLPNRDGGASAFGMWFAIGLAAVVFASVHVAPEGQDAALTALQMVRLLAGAGFGWLFWKRGLKAAMTAHFTYDMVLFYGIVMVL